MVKGELVSMKRIYLDYAASTPVDRRITKVASAAFVDFGNPGSLHFFGQKAISLLDVARQKTADYLACDFRDVIFTSGATESNNLALRGVIKKLQELKNNKSLHIISTTIEHKSVLATLKDLEKEGVQVSYVEPNNNGKVEVENIISKIKENTVLVSVMTVNNETGVIQPIKEISTKLKNIIFHTDATQYIGYLKNGLDDLGADLISFSGHKIYAPKGIGGLYINSNISILPLLTGGDQENGLRAGTENVFGSLSLAEALLISKKEGENEKERLEKLSRYFLKELKKIRPDVVLNSGDEKIVSHILNIRFPNEKSDELLVRLDLAGVAVSAGSACTARAIIPSYVLLAMGLSDEQARESLRFSFGRQTTMGEIKRVLKILGRILEK